jgi:hypothetical protein
MNVHRTLLSIKLSIHLNELQHLLQYSTDVTKFVGYLPVSPWGIIPLQSHFIGSSYD